LTNYHKIATRRRLLNLFATKKTKLTTGGLQDEQMLIRAAHLTKTWCKHLDKSHYNTAKRKRAKTICATNIKTTDTTSFIKYIKEVPQ